MLLLLLCAFAESLYMNKAENKSLSLSFSLYLSFFLLNGELEFSLFCRRWQSTGWQCCFLPCRDTLNVLWIKTKPSTSAPHHSVGKSCKDVLCCSSAGRQALNAAGQTPCFPHWRPAPITSAGDHTSSARGTPALQLARVLICLLAMAIYVVLFFYIIKDNLGPVSPYG